VTVEDGPGLPTLALQQDRKLSQIKDLAGVKSAKTRKIYIHSLRKRCSSPTLRSAQRAWLRRPGHQFIDAGGRPRLMSLVSTSVSQAMGAIEFNLQV
jgi:hypothetical protein